jgi:hypothetical protein
LLCFGLPKTVLNDLHQPEQLSAEVGSTTAIAAISVKSSFHLIG